MLVRPVSVDAAAATLDVVGVRVVGRAVTIPRRFVRRVVQPLPDLPSDLELIQVRLRGDLVEVSLRSAGLRLPIRPEHVRSAVREGVALLRM